MNPLKVPSRDLLGINFFILDTYREQRLTVGNNPSCQYKHLPRSWGVIKAFPDNTARMNPAGNVAFVTSRTFSALQELLTSR